MIPCGSPDSALNPAHNLGTHARCPGSRLSEPALCSGSHGLSPISLIPNGPSGPPRCFRIPHCIPLGTSTLVRYPRLARDVTSSREARLQQPGPTGTHAWRFRSTVIDRAAVKYRMQLRSPHCITHGTSHHTRPPGQARVNIRQCIPHSRPESGRAPGTRTAPPHGIATVGGPAVTLRPADHQGVCRIDLCGLRIISMHSIL